MRDLAKEGYIARNRLLELERTYAQINGAVSEDIGNIGRTQRQIAELKLRRIHRQQEYQKEVSAPSCRTLKKKRRRSSTSSAGWIMILRMSW